MKLFAVKLSRVKKEKIFTGVKLNGLLSTAGRKRVTMKALVSLAENFAVLFVSFAFIIV